MAMFAGLLAATAEGWTWVLVLLPVAGMWAALRWGWLVRVSDGYVTVGQLLPWEGRHTAMGPSRGKLFPLDEATLVQIEDVEGKQIARYAFDPQDLLGSDDMYGFFATKFVRLSRPGRRDLLIGSRDCARLLDVILRAKSENVRVAHR
jgi:hypothetical protein